MGDRAAQWIEVDLVHVDAATDLLEQRDGESTAEVLSKLLETVDQPLLPESRIEDRKPEPDRGVEDPVE